jgi:hypothetical protein
MEEIRQEPGAGSRLNLVMGEAVANPVQQLDLIGMFASGPDENFGCRGRVARRVTSLKVQRVSCAKGEKVIKAYHRCRHLNGGPAGTCGSTLLGFKCKDGKRTRVPNVQYNAAAKCRNGSNPSKRVKSRYTQNT